jgi:hypothetical protein
MTVRRVAIPGLTALPRIAGEARVVARLALMMRQPAWALPAIVVLGLLSSLFESLGLSLFIPLLHTHRHRGDHGDGDPQELGRLRQ